MASLASPPTKDPRNHWSKEEHAQFLQGVAAHGRGEWAAIARDFVPTRTGTQVCNHGQKYFAKLDRDRGVASVSGGASAPARASLAERSGSATEKQSSVDRPGTLPHVFNAFGRRPKFTATWRREAHTETETETDTDTRGDGARADLNPRGKRARAWVRDASVAVGDAATSTAASPSVTLYGETHDAIPPGGSIVDALATPGVSACPPATRSYLGGARGGGDLAKVCAGAAHALFRKRPPPGSARDFDRRASGGDDIAADEEEERFGADGVALTRHVCPEPGCGKVFYDSAKFRKHALTHGEKAYPCRYPGCGKRFLDASKLKRHWLTHDGVEGRQHLCPYAECCLPFATRRAVSEHVVLAGSHENEKFYWCPVESCPKRFATKAKMLEHLKSHGDVDWETGT